VLICTHQCSPRGARHRRTRIRKRTHSSLL
jgi:hypothetical protein